MRKILYVSLDGSKYIKFYYVWIIFYLIFLKEEEQLGANSVYIDYLHPAANSVCIDYLHPAANSVYIDYLHPAANSHFVK